ncbi:YaiI/YqxD family protein [Clostridium sp. LIBA-8841]|uniref:YaiI/YqxD family protein n=1 Tax=Clostridium sp. LIBA-8841 TaxID=2987530 RepID=UPI002AC7B091|nr:YaiI/YqxD family protein [Clostridium sp. LIBA-8841]MDZ5255083.1 YaiI/YqxD family protein [Clostridium sp. LIBA-8841]
MKIVVDGDGCAGREIIEKVAKENSIKILIYCTINHMIRSDYSEVKIVDDGFQSVDMYVANATEKNDIVVTQDYGVAAMALGKGALAISPRGYIYDNNNIDRLLFERHLSQKNRRAGGRTKGNHKRSKEDDERLYYNLKKLIEKTN